VTTEALVLSPEEIVDLYKKGLVGFESLLDCMMGLLVEQSKTYIPGMSPPDYSRRGSEDIFQELCVELVKAAADFDPEHGTRFSTLVYRYCTQRIQQLRRTMNSDKSQVLNKAESLESLESNGVQMTYISDFTECELYDGLDPEEKIVVQMMLENEYVVDVATRIGETRSKVYRIIEGLKTKLFCLADC